MALVVKDRVQETTTTTGTGTVTLAGAVTGFQTFAAIGDGNTCYYAITSGSDWEVGLGTYTASGTTLSRDTILESSNAGSAITLSGTSNVFVTYPAEKAIYTDANDVLNTTEINLSTVKLNGSTSGEITISAPAVAGTNTLTLPTKTGTIGLYAAPQVTVLTSGTGTYTTPTGAAYLVIEMVGGGAGGMASSSAGAPATGGAGGNTTFGTSLLTCNGAGASSYGGANAGGTATVSSPAVGSAIQGSAGASPSLGYNSSVPYASGGMGGCGPFGGAGQNQWSTNNAGNAAANSGSGGGGAGSDTGTIAIPGGGGGSGGYIKAFITSPSASYSYAVGAGGTGGAAGPNGANGGNGGSGIIIVTAYFG